VGIATAEGGIATAEYGIATAEGDGALDLRAA